jgi:hypothetical protein
MAGHRFKPGMLLSIVCLPSDEALAMAREIGAEYVWFDRVPDAPEIADTSEAEVDLLAAQVERHRLKRFLIIDQL